MEQGTQEWRELRKTKIGASDAPVIMGVSPWKTPYQLWEEKIFDKEQKVTWSMADGVRKEEAARQRFEAKTGKAMIPYIYINQERPWQMASLDGFSFDKTEILEIKHADKDVFKMALDGKIPHYYMIQIQHALDTTAAEVCHYMVSNDEKDAYVIVFPDKKLIQEIRVKNEKFYEYITSKEPPPLMEKDFVINEDKEFIDLMAEYIGVKHDLDILKDCEQVLREKLITMAQEKNTICSKGKMTRSVCKGAVDYKLIPELFGIDLDQYRKPPCEKWRISDISKDGT